MKIKTICFLIMLPILLGSLAYSRASAQNSDLSKDNKYNLIRSLVKKRIYSDPSLRDKYISGTVPRVESFPDVVLIGLPEGTIVTIVETYLIMKRESSASNGVIFNAIENHRKTLFPESGRMPNPLTLSNYIKYRLEIEHSHGVGLSDTLIMEAINESINALK